MSSLCDTCTKRTKEITWVGFSTVAWTGKYVCGVLSTVPVPDVVHECSRYMPKNRGQMTLEAFA